MSVPEQIIEDLRKWNIFSATEAFHTVMETFKRILLESPDLETALRNVAYFARRVVDARPTSALLINAVREVLLTVLDHCSDLGELRSEVTRRIEELRSRIEQANDFIARFLARRVQDGDTILTHSYSRVVLKAFRYAVEEGKRFRVYVTESRPGAEGLKMAEDVAALGVETTLIVDSAARYFMKEIDKVFMGCEAVAANGAVINKVGASLIALAAHEARVRVFVAANTWKISPETIFGELVRIVEKPPTSLVSEDKLVKWFGRVTIRAPAYDVTPPEYIDAIVTERGFVAPQAIIFLVRELYGWPPRRLEEVYTIVEQVEEKVR